MLALEAALESQRLDTEDRIAQASKAAVQTAAELRQHLPSTPTPLDGLAPPPGRLAPHQDAGSLSPLDRVAGALIKGGAAMFQGSPSRQPMAHAATARAGPHPGTPSGSTAAGSYETELDRRTAEAQRKAQALALQQRNENQDTLVVAISRPLGFDRGRPVAAVLIFRCAFAVELVRRNAAVEAYPPVVRQEAYPPACHQR